MLSIHSRFRTLGNSNLVFVSGFGFIVSKFLNLMNSNLLYNLRFFSFTRLKGPLKIFKELVALFPIRPKVFIKKTAEFIEEFAPHRLAAFEDDIC